eukprot:symbB.v1.2.041558.t1/scaffold8353.1/size6692/1
MWMLRFELNQSPAAPKTLAQRLFESALQENDGLVTQSSERPKGEALMKLEESLLTLQGEVSKGLQCAHGECAGFLSTNPRVDCFSLGLLGSLA